MKLIVSFSWRLFEKTYWRIEEEAEARVEVGVEAISVKTIKFDENFSIFVNSR